MRLSSPFLLLALAALPIAILSTTWLYLYPPLHGCAFPTPSPSSPAPFRLLALGDPQLEGDSSLPKASAPAFPALKYLTFDLQHAGTWKTRRRIVRDAIVKVTTRDLPRWLEGYRKRIDLWGNDYYLAHVVRQTRWWTQPTHVAVLGDLLGSQWISDVEFEKRAGRYWNTVFRGFEKVPEEIMTGVVHEEETDDTQEAQQDKKWGGTTELLGAKTWTNRLINIPGNHDIGYAGDFHEARAERFERVFGSLNWDIVFELPRSPTNTTASPSLDRKTPSLRLVILNDMNLDTPAYSFDLQTQTYTFLNHIIATSKPVEDKTHTTVLLTHIPLHKEKGICTDAPFFSFFQSNGGVKEQNMLSPYSSKLILENVFGLSGNPDVEGGGLGRRGVVINGHDHAGCDVLHYIAKEEARKEDKQELDIDVTKFGNETSSEDTESRDETPVWQAVRIPHNEGSPLPQNATTPHLREITLRSMMGDYAGYAGFLSAWFDESLGEEGEWRIEFASCGMGIQHWWWAVHIMDFIVLVLFLIGGVAWGCKVSRRSAKAGKDRSTDKKE